MFVRLGALLVMAMAISASAGTMFRLEIGPPIAAGTGSTTMPQFKKKVLLVVRPLVCDDPGAVRMTGTAEGSVNGVRQSLPLDLIAVDTAKGVHAVTRQWPENGSWVLQLNGSCPSPKASASTLVPMSGNTFIREKTEVLREPATRQQLEAMLAALMRSQASASPRGLVVHEWGTFLAMNGSDGVTLDGMYHEEHALPAFVHARSRDELRLRASNLKGETPVIYFYTDRPVRVGVQVGFPGGLWTQWYPQADFVGPSLVQSGSLPDARNGRIGWTVDVVPPPLARPSLPEAPADALWQYSRHVDAAFVSAVDSTRPGYPKEWERFLFYRGLGEARLPLDVSANRGGRLTCGPDLSEGVRDIYLIRVEHGKGVYRHVPSLTCGEPIANVVPSMVGAQDINRFATAITNHLAARLVAHGLYAPEARAMVNTWRTSYFTTDGIRVLFVLPRSWTDRFIPITINPRPDELVRVMVGRIELLTPERERDAEAAVSSLASPDPKVREQAFAMLRDQGRYVEPILRRTLQSASSEPVRLLSRRLLMTDFVTDLRSSLTRAADGTRVVQEPVYARAQLASLLREIGLNDEARQEAESALTALARMPPPTMSDHASRNTFRALARAHEAAGHDTDALKWYSDFVEFASGFRSCSNCHQLAGPRDTSFFRDWWAGRKFAELAWRTGEAPRLIEADEAALARAPNRLLPQIRLAYLYAAHGNGERAQRLWSLIDRSNDRLARADSEQ